MDLGNYWKKHFLLLIALCRKFLHVPCHAMAGRIWPTKMEEQFDLSNMKINAFSGKSIRKVF